jgi:hypothetical protein
MRLTNGNGAAWGRLGLDGVGGTKRGCSGAEAAAQRTQTGFGVATSDLRSGFRHEVVGFGQELSDGGFYMWQIDNAITTAQHSQLEGGVGRHCHRHVGPTQQQFQGLKTNPKISFSRGKIAIEGIKIRKNRGGRKSNMAHFSLLTLLPILHHFELFQRFQVKLDLTKLWSIKLIATAIANPPEFNFGCGCSMVLYKHCTMILLACTR